MFNHLVTAMDGWGTRQLRKQMQKKLKYLGFFLIPRLLPDEDISLEHCRYLSEKQMIQMHTFP